MTSAVRAAIVDAAWANAAAEGRSQPRDHAFGPVVRDHEIAVRRARYASRGQRHSPSLHAASLACAQLTLPSTTGRTGIIVATSHADRQVASRYPGAFLASTTHASRQKHRLDVLVAISRFVAGGLLQDLAAMLELDGPELCLPGDTGLTPLALATLFIDAGRADAMIVVAVDPSRFDPHRYEAVATVVAPIPVTAEARWTPSLTDRHDEGGACVSAISAYWLSGRVPRDDLADVRRNDCVVSWGGLGAPADAEHWIESSRELLDDCLDKAATKNMAVVAASFLDLAPEHALQTMRRDLDPRGMITAGTSSTLWREALQDHVHHRGIHGPYINVSGIPGASLIALAIAEDMVRQGVVPAVAVVAGDWMGDGVARALGILACPDQPHLHTTSAALLLQRAADCPQGRGLHALVARREACDGFDADVSTHAPTHGRASGCTSEDLEEAERFLARSLLPCPKRVDHRFLGADALACLARTLESNERTALSVRNLLGGSGVVLF